MPELPTLVIWPHLHCSYDVIIIFQNTSILKRAGVADFADIIKMVILLINKTFKDLIKSK